MGHRVHNQYLNERPILVETKHLCSRPEDLKTLNPFLASIAGFYLYCCSLLRLGSGMFPNYDYCFHFYSSLKSYFFLLFHFSYFLFLFLIFFSSLSFVYLFFLFVFFFFFFYLFIYFSCLFFFSSIFFHEVFCYLNMCIFLRGIFAIYMHIQGILLPKHTYICFVRYFCYIHAYPRYLST